MKINTNIWKIVLRFGLRRVPSGPISVAQRGISVLKIKGIHGPSETSNEILNNDFNC